MRQLIDGLGVVVDFVPCMLICFIELALPLFVIALLIHLWHKSMKQNEREDISPAKERVVNSLVLVIFPPVASYEYGIRKALITLLAQFFGFIATFSLLILMHKKCGVNIDFIMGIVFLIILSWGLGILCAIVQKKKSTKL